MLIFGVCVGSEERYAAHAKPWLEKLALNTDVEVWRESDPKSIASAYNRLIDRAAQRDDLDGLVLIHDDVEIRDPCAIEKLIGELTAPDAGVVGVVGGTGAKGLAWWDAPTKHGFVIDARGAVDFGHRNHAVDHVDGLLLALSRKCVRYVRLPEQDGFHGYDGEICFAARAMGLAVRTLDLDVYHGSRGGYGDEAAFHAADIAFRRRWMGPALYCPSCGQPFPRRAGLAPVEIVTCPSCGTGATCPPPARNIGSSDIFDAVYAGSRLTRRAQWFEEARARIAWVESYATGPRLLEIGSATGEFVQLAAGRGWNARGVEPSAWAAEEARKIGADVTCGTHASMMGTRAEVVCAWHVLEHVEEPLDWLHDIASILQPDGLLFLEVPHFGSRSAERDGAAWFCASTDDHFWHFTTQGISELLSRAGFEFVGMQPISYRVYDGAHAWSARVAAWKEEGHDTPSLDLLRVVARVRTLPPPW